MKCMLKQAPDRRIRRLMEKDNKKERDASRRYTLPHSINGSSWQLNFQ
jgi:hypothetical protein